jgi:ubiquinone/menaquinone biosynthesis C-methylase UbiE
MRKIIRLFCPPIFIKVYHKLTSKTDKRTFYRPEDTDSQELDVYWTDSMAHQLENWGKDHTWNEIECLLVNCKGKVLDIACGTGVNIIAMQKFGELDIHGFDISDFLIKKAIEKGINPAKLRVEDATKTSYQNNEFDYSYSIGSLEHFTEEGIDLFLKECSRITKQSAFHMIPVSESGKNDGWIRTNQSFHNNSLEWWTERYLKYFSKVYVINSGWKDTGLSIGKWFVCVK